VEKKFQVFDRGYAATIKMYEKDMENASKNFQSFISHQTDEMTNIVTDVEKVINIDLAAGDGSGILEHGRHWRNLDHADPQGRHGVRSVGLALLASWRRDRHLRLDPDHQPQFGRWLHRQHHHAVLGGADASDCDQRIIVPPPPATSWCAAADVSTSLTLGLWGMTHNQAVTFQGLSTSTYPILQSNRINAGGNPLTEAYLRSALSVVNVVSGKDIDEFAASHAQFDAYEALGFAQKRFQDSTLDKGYETLQFAGKKFFKDVDIPPAVVYGISKSTVKFGEVTSLNFSEMDGSVLKFVPNFMAYQAWLREFGQMLFTNPNQNVVIDTLSYNLTNPAYTR
jgi:hypothetical protein